MQLVEIVRTKGACLNRRSFQLTLMLTCCLISLTKKTGIYFVLVTLMVFALIYKRHLLRFIAPLIAPTFLMFIILPVAIFPLLDVAPGGKQEILGPLFQQTARYVDEYHEEISPEEKAIIDRVLNYDTLPERYNPFITDYVKYMYNTESTTSELISYFKVWIHEGLKHPTVYFEATLAPVSPFFSTGILVAQWDTETNGELLYRPQFLDNHRAFMMDLFNFEKSLPLLNIPFYSALWLLLLPLAIIYLCYRRTCHLTPLLVPLLILIAFCAISPMYDTRYALPIIYFIPWFILLLLSPVSYGLRNRKSAPPA